MIREKEFDDIAILHNISKLTSSFSLQISPLTLLTNLLKAIFPYFKKDDALRFITMQCFSREKDGEIRRMENIPSIFDTHTTPADQIPARLREVVLFLTASQIINSKKHVGAAGMLSVFGDKFCIETVCETGLSPADSRINYNKRFETLTIHTPSLYKMPKPKTFFPWLEAELADMKLSPVLGRGALVDGVIVDRLIGKVFSSGALGEFAGFVHGFLMQDTVQRIIDALIADFAPIIKELDRAIMPDELNKFCKTIVLHSFFKPAKYSYQVIVNRKEELNASFYHSTILLNSESPFPLDRLNFFHIGLNMSLSAINNSMRIIRQNKKLENQSHSSFFCGMVGSSPEIQKVYGKIRKVARFDTDVLILGESGTGKDMIAQAIHKMSACKDGPFVAVSLSDRPDTLIDSELFGHEKGAFTGAVSTKLGYFERAQGGTLFLDEISHIPQNVQAKLLRVFQTREFERVGGSASIKANIRIICATSEDLRNKEIRENLEFLDPLYYRLEQFVITVPPLRKRKQDIPLIVDFYLKKMGQAGEVRISDEALDFLMGMDWPGNIRQLIATLKRAYIEAYDEGCIYPRHFDVESHNVAYAYEALNRKLRTTLDFLRRNNFVIDHTLYDMKQNAFELSRKTLIRYTRELCLWFLSICDWDLKEAISALAGADSCERNAALRYKNYFIGDKRTAGILNQLSQNKTVEEFNAFIRETVHHDFKKHILTLKNKVSTMHVSRDTWNYILSQYSTRLQ